MLYFLSLIILKFSIYLTYDIIPLKHFEKKTVHYTPTQTFFIFSYDHILSSNSEYSTFTLMKYQYDFSYYYCYIYKNPSDIRQNFNGDFINYDKNCSLYYSDYYFPDDEKVSSGKYYFVIQISSKTEESFTTFMAYSSGIPYNIQNTFYSIFSFKRGVFKYTFFPINHAKYIRFGFKRITGSGNFGLTIYQNNDTIIYNRTDDINYVEHFELNESYSYSIKLKLEGAYSRTDFSQAFFIILSNYSKMIPVEIKTKNFQDFPIFSGINLLLDMSKISKNNKMLIEYSNKWMSDNFTVEGYDTDDLITIDSTSGTELELFKHKGCFNTCKDYILKNDDNIKKVLFKVQKENPWDYYIFEIKYGEQTINEKILLSPPVWIGLSLSIPNIILQIIRNKRQKKTEHWITLAMNIFLHLAYGFIIGRYIINEGDLYLLIGGWLLKILIFLFLICILFSFCCCYPVPFVKILYDYCKGLKKLKTAKEVFYYYKKLPPKVFIKAVSKHEESREVWREYKDINTYVISRFGVDYYDKQLIKIHESSWKRTDQGGGKMPSYIENKRKNCEIYDEKRTIQTYNSRSEYKYESWQDNTIISDELFKSDYDILNIELDFRTQYNKESGEDIRKIKYNFQDNGGENTPDMKFEEKIECPGLPKYVKCFKDESVYKKIQKKNIKIFGIWIFMLILGYSSIIETYFEIENEENNYDQKSIKYVKLISGAKNCRAGYMENDEIFYDKKIALSDEGKKRKIKNKYNFGKKKDEKIEPLFKMRTDKKDNIIFDESRLIFQNKY